MKFIAASLLGVVKLSTVSFPIFVREWIGLLVFFVANPMSSMMLILRCLVVGWRMVLWERLGVVWWPFSS
jgi:multisubunit Na+/H+ antiporter MnhG subunit